ncbi:hypothetical protein V491_04705 [Pseudogymnoascus sp. VKM F-3775]|nr:hypothetical protein V491_04705 [Pseudogymnoascus sp. VKM F-3775]
MSTTYVPGPWNMSAQPARDKPHKTDVVEKGFSTHQTKRYGPSNAQLERKRIHDRDAQRTYRKRKREEDEQKEEQIRQLKERVQELEAELRLLRAATDNNNISLGMPMAPGDLSTSGNLYTNDFMNSFKELPMVAQLPKYHHSAFHQVAGEEGDLGGLSASIQMSLYPCVGQWGAYIDIPSIHSFLLKGNPIPSIFKMQALHDLVNGAITSVAHFEDNNVEAQQNADELYREFKKVDEQLCKAKDKAQQNLAQLCSTVPADEELYKFCRAFLRAKVLCETEAEVQRKAEAEAKVQPRDRAIGGSYGQLATYHQNLAELCRAFLEAITRPGKELPQAFREAINRAYEATVDYLSSGDLRKVIRKLEEVKTALVFGGKGYDVLNFDMESTGSFDKYRKKNENRHPLFIEHQEELGSQINYLQELSLLLLPSNFVSKAKARFSNTYITRKCLLKAHQENLERRLLKYESEGAEIKPEIRDAASKVLKENQLLRQKNEMLREVVELAFEDRMIYDEEASQQECSLDNLPCQLQWNEEALQQVSRDLPNDTPGKEGELAFGDPRVQHEQLSLSAADNV